MLTKNRSLLDYSWGCLWPTLQVFRSIRGRSPDSMGVGPWYQLLTVRPRVMSDTKRSVSQCMLWDSEIVCVRIRRNVFDYCRDTLIPGMGPNNDPRHLWRRELFWSSIMGPENDNWFSVEGRWVILWSPSRVRRMNLGTGAEIDTLILCNGTGEWYWSLAEGQRVILSFWSEARSRIMIIGRGAESDTLIITRVPVDDTDPQHGVGWWQSDPRQGPKWDTLILDKVHRYTNPRQGMENGTLILARFITPSFSTVILFAIIYNRNHLKN